MEYPQYFVALVKATYPKSPDLHKALDKGSEIVGRYLDDSSVIKLQKNTSALNRVKFELYNLWLEIYREQKR
ncbi:hypothetical protein HDR63_03595 [bacterium]|nr:hypothetical protein [bacterium]